MIARQQIKSKCEIALNFASKQVKHLIEKYPGVYPEFTVCGKWSPNANPWTSWCEGFLPGQMWILHEYTGDQWWREQAEKYTLPLEPRKSDRSVHDLGFIFWSTYKRWFDITGDKKLNAVLIEAGKTMSLRFNEKGKILAILFSGR